MSRIGVLSAALSVLTAALVGCSTQGTPTAASTTAPASTTTTTTAPNVTTVPSTTTEPATSPYVVGSTRVTGATDRATYDVEIPQISGGNPAVTTEFNQSMRAALQDLIDDDYGVQDRFALSDGYAKASTHVGDRVVSSEQITSWEAVPPGAHGDSLISTVTIDADTAKPISLDDAFTDLDAGLARLSQQAALILPTTPAGNDYQRSGMAPILNNYANWTASPDGMRIHFGDYQVGAYALGLITITVPWDALSDVLAPGMEDVLSS